MYYNGIEERQAPVNSCAQNHYIDKKRQDNILEKHRVVFDEFTGPERVEKSPGKIGHRIIFQVECHGVCAVSGQYIIHLLL